MKIPPQVGQLGRRLVQEFGPREWHVYGGILLVSLGCRAVSEPLGVGMAGGLLLLVPAYLRWLAAKGGA